MRALSFFVTLPLVFPPVALGYLLLLLIGRSGPLGGMLDAVGISIVFTPWAVYLAAFIAGLPLVIRPIQGALASEQLKALEFAARVHGAPPLTVYRKVTLRAAARHFSRKRRSGHHDDGGREHFRPHQYTLA